MVSREARRGVAIPAALAVLALVGLSALVLYLAAAPLTTNDLWWTLAHGEAYAHQGPWLEADPCLYTAEGPPAPHQWLFALALHGVERGFGLRGLRVAHALAVAGILWLVWSLFRREAEGTAAACLATCVFLVLSWYRLIQLRPELVSVAATLALYRLLLEPDAVPSWRRVGASTALLVVWANLHALFMIGPLLILAALAGVGVRIGLRRWAGLGAPAGELRRARRLAAALALGLVAALLNPGGIQQHLAFLTSSQAGAIFVVLDEWTAFDPLAPSNYAPAVSLAAWLLTDLLLLGFLAAALVVGVRLLRAPSQPRLEAADPVRLALGLAGALALLVSIRFLWMSVFPLLFLLRFQRLESARAAPRSAWVCAAASLAVALAFPLWGGFTTAAALFPRDLRAYLSDSYTGHRFFEPGLRFLEETGVEGRLFNAYPMGGILCYRLAPRIRTFVDGSLNFPADVQRDYQQVNLQRGVWPFESHLDVLDRRNVDLYFGIGVPAGGTRTAADGTYTTANLEQAPGWIPVSRSFRHAIYLRANERNRENLRRIAAYYESRGVPFDPERGLDPGAVIEARPDWAAGADLLPPAYPELQRAAQGDDPDARFRALERLGLAYALAGAYELQLRNDREAAALRPEAKAPLRRIAYAQLRLGRGAAARRTAAALLALERHDPRSVLVALIADRYWRAQARANPMQGLAPVPLDAPVNELPLLRSRNPLRQ